MEKNLQPSKRSKPILDDANGVVQVVREQPPQHCILKIDSFSVLQDALSNSGKDHINSTQFQAGGYTWVLSVYPNGNEEENGVGHLSLYVTLIGNLSIYTLANATLRFFIYDQIRDNYVTFMDVGDQRFDALKTTRGIAKVLSLDSFSDASNGFLLNDCCTFGAEILVTNGPRSRSMVSLLQSECERSYTWKINNFSDLNNDRLSSPVFSFGEWSWKLVLYPRGNGRAKGKNLSLYLELDNANDLTYGRNLYTKYCLRIKNQHRIGADKEEIVHKWFSSESTSWGFGSFLSISDLYNAAKRFLMYDTLIVEVIIQVMLLLKDMDPTPNKKIKCVSFRMN